MDNFIKRRLCFSVRVFILIVIIALVIASGFQQKLYFEIPVNAQSNVPSLMLEVSSAKTNYLQIEPISLNFRLSNRTNQSIPWKGALMIGRNVNFLSRSDTGEEFRFEGSKYATGLIYSPLKTMPPGEQIQENLLLDRALSEVIFPTPGHYDLQVEFVYDSDSERRQQVKILSNSISINISEPTGVDCQAYEYIKGPLELAHRQTNVRALAQVQQEFVNRYRNTVYAKYIIWSLANTYRGLGEDEKALRELCKISGEDFHYSKDLQRKVYEIEEKLRPFIMLPLPENVPAPIRPHPCARLQN